MSEENKQIDWQSLLEKNIKLSEEIFKQNKKISRRLLMISLAGYIKLVLLLIPIILALIYLPPIIKDVWKQYSQVTGMFSGGSGQELKNLLNVLQR